MKRTFGVTFFQAWRRESLTAGLCACALACMPAPSPAGTVSTIPSGYFNVTIPAGTSSSATPSVLSFPLLGTANAGGAMSGVVTGITANTITSTGAAWSAGALSQSTTPCLIQFTSGAAAGRTFLISTSTANTSTTVTLDSQDASQVDLTTLGIMPGTDTYQIYAANTISSIFGTPATTGVLGGSGYTGVDEIELLVPGFGWKYFYYNTASGWLEIGPPIPSGNVVIRPDAALIYVRYGTTPMNLALLGQVPPQSRQALVSNGAPTVLSNSWPVNITLGSSNLSQMPGWVANTNYKDADLVEFLSPIGWLLFYYNGSHWMEVGPPINSDNYVIPAGSGLIISRLGSTSGQSTLSQALPYSL